MSARSMAPASTRRAALLAVIASPVMAAASRPVAAAAAAAVGTHPDAGLIADCAEFERLERLFVAAYDGPDAIEDDGELERVGNTISARLHRLSHRICAGRPTTLDGHMVRARALQSIQSDYLTEFASGDTTVARLLQAVLRDLVEVS